MASPTSRTKEWLRAQGFLEDTAEQRQAWKTPAGFSPLRDWCNFADLIAFDHRRTVAVQCTSTSNQASRVAKCLAEPRAFLWASGAGREVWVVGWKKYAAPLPGRRVLWRPTLRVLRPEEWAPDVQRGAAERVLAQMRTGEKLLAGLRPAE